MVKAKKKYYSVKLRRNDGKLVPSEQVAVDGDGAVRAALTVVELHDKFESNHFTYEVESVMEVYG